MIWVHCLCLFLGFAKECLILLMFDLYNDLISSRELFRSSIMLKKGVLELIWVDHCQPTIAKCDFVIEEYLQFERCLCYVIYSAKYQRMTAATWPAGPWPLINSPMMAAINPSIATLPLRRSTKSSDPWFHGRLVVSPSPNASKGSYWKFWRDNGHLPLARVDFMQRSLIFS